MIPLFIFTYLLIVWIFILEIREINKYYHVVEVDKAKVKVIITFIILLFINTILLITYLT